MSAAVSPLSSVVSTSFRCDYCSQEQPKKRCGRCQLVKYCSPDCQKLAWKAHHHYMCVAKTDPLNEKAYLSPSKDRILAPVHYAALFGKWEAMPQEIQSTYTTAVTKEGATPEDFHRLTSNAQEEMTTAYVEGREDPLTQEEYRALTGTAFRNGYYMIPEDVTKFFANPTKECTFIDLYTANANDAPVVEEFYRHPPKIALVQESPVMGLGIRTKVPVGNRAIICSFGGQLTTTPPHHSNILQFDRLNKENKPDLYPMTLDPTKYTNLASFSNDGPPNCVPSFIFQKGLPPMVVLLALRPIEEGEFIHWMYGGGHPLRALHYSLTKASERDVRSYCLRKLHTEQDYQIMREKLRSPSENPYDVNFVDYIVSTPQLFTELLLRGVLNPELSIAFVQSPELINFINKTNLAIRLTYYPILISQIAKIRNHEDLKEILLQQSSQLTCIAFLELVRDIFEDSFDRANLQSYLDKAQIFDAFNLFAQSPSLAPEEGWDRLLDAYARLPAFLKNGLIPRYLNKRAGEDSCETNKVQQLKSLALALSIEEMTLEELRIAPGDGAEAQRRVMRDIVLNKKVEEAKS